MKNVVLPLILCLFLGISLHGQIKIGENPQNLDASSVLELESTNRVLVITRVTNAQMLSITPLRGAMVYNTDTQCVHFFTGTEWFNPCDRPDEQTFSTEAIVNPDPTIVITEDPATSNFNFEVGMINGLRNIVPSTVNGDLHIQPNSIRSLQLGNDSVTLDKLANGLIDGQLIQWNGTEWVLIEETAINVSEIDGVVGNEIRDVFDATLTRTGSGTDADPFLVDVSPLGITEQELADDAVTTIKILDGNVTNDKLDKPNIPLSGFQAAAANVDLGNFQINNLQDPTLPQDAATRNYVDTEIIASTQVIVSADGGNSITESATDGGAFYDDSALQTNIATNATDIATNQTNITNNATNIATNASDIVINQTNIANNTTNITTNTTDIGTNQTNITNNANNIATNTSDIAINQTNIATNTANITTNTGNITTNTTNIGTNQTNITNNANNIATNATNLVDHIADDGDLDDQNELSDLDLTATTLTLTNAAAGATGVDLDAVFATDAELAASADDDISSATFDAASNVLTINEGSSFVTANLSDLDNSAATVTNATNLANHITDDGDLNDQNELSDLDLTATTLTLTNAAAGATGVDLDAVFATDAELAASADDDISSATFDAASNVLTINEGSSFVTANLSDLDNTAATVTNATNLANHITDDGDLNDQNELSDLDLTATTLTLTNAAAGATGVDLDAVFATDAELAASADQIVSLADGGSGNVTIGGTYPNLTIDVPSLNDGDLSSTEGTIAITGTVTGALFEDIDIDVANNTITSAKIVDGTITNADIAAMAAIAGSKIDPTFTTDVTTTGDFLNVPDFVFEKYYDGFSNLNDKYRFRSLKEVEEFVKKNKHLPGIQSAYELKTSRQYHLTQSSLNHLEKIEELFLHTIEQEKKIEKLTSENQKLTDELNSLKADIETIKEMLVKKNEEH